MKKQLAEDASMTPGTFEDQHEIESRDGLRIGPGFEF
jgi:hypothetical protein